MINETMKYQLDGVCMESFYDMRNSQPAKERLHYFDVVLEGSVESNAVLLQKLYSDIISKSNINFGQIPDSCGALTKYSGYKLMSESMDKINKLFEGIPSEEVKLMNRLHDVIISSQKDYEFGYKFDIEIVKLAYCVSVMVLNDMINICIMTYTTQLRKNAGIEFAFKKMKKNDVIAIRGAKSLVKSYEKGQWAKMMQQLKKDPSMFGVGSGIATEGIGDFVGGLSTVLTGKFDDRVETIKNSVNSIPNVVKIPVAIVVCVIALLAVIRECVYLYFNSANSVKEWSRSQKEFVDIVVEQEKEDGTSNKVVQKHSKLSQKLENLANFIEVRIFKANKDAKKDLEQSNKENFTSSSFGSSAFGGSIEL